MSNRASIRFIAKARLQAMGVQNVNCHMGTWLSNSKNRKLQRTSQGCKLLNKLRKKYKPLWRQVTGGALAAEGRRAQLGFGFRRRYRVV